jgi:SAM-dependent MidA family methyltransferase
LDLSGFAAAENSALREVIAQKIDAEGPISFAGFYELALYHPDLGYYMTCDPARDYQSSPNVHPVFAAALARQLQDLWLLLDRPSRFDVFEAGAGNGRLAADVLQTLRRHYPDFYDAVRYQLLDPSYSARAKGLEHSRVLAEKATVATALPSQPAIEGCILSNELLDALPFHRVRVRDGRLLELRVGRQGDDFVDVEAAAAPEIEAYFARLGLMPGEGCDAEAGLEAERWQARAAVGLKRGYVLTLDYGYEADALYAPWRKRGTLLTFYRHTGGEDPFVRVGRQDITCSVNFTSVIAAGEAAGLTTLWTTTQTEFLASLGMGEALRQPPAPQDIEAYYALRRAVMELTDPSGLGRIRVLLQGRDVPALRPLVDASGDG